MKIKQIKINIGDEFKQFFFLIMSINLCKELIFMRKNYRTSKNLAGPVDSMCSWSYGASNILS